MSPLVWTGIAIAAALALVGLWVWLWFTPRIRPIDADELPSVRGQYPPPDDDADDCQCGPWPCVGDWTEGEPLTEPEIRDRMRAEGWEPVHAQTFEEHTAQAMDLIHDAVFTGEDDEPVEDVVAAFDRGKKGVTKRPEWSAYRTYSCIHSTVSGPLGGPPELSCGCDMQEEK